MGIKVEHGITGARTHDEMFPEAAAWQRKWEIKAFNEFVARGPHGQPSKWAERATAGGMTEPLLSDLADAEPRRTIEGIEPSLLRIFMSEIIDPADAR